MAPPHIEIFLIYPSFIPEPYVFSSSWANWNIKVLILDIKFCFAWSKSNLHQRCGVPYIMVLNADAKSDSIL